MKKLIPLCILSPFLAACGSEVAENTPPPAASVAPTIVADAASATDSRPIYKIRTVNQPYPPFNIYDPANPNKITGMETEILEAIGKHQGFRVQYVPYVWDSIFKNMHEENTVLVGGGLSIDDMDLNEVVISKPYLRSLDCIVAANDKNLAKWNTRSVAIIDNDYIEDELTQDFGVRKNNVQYVKSQYQGLQYIAEGKAVSTVSDCTVLQHYMRSLPNQKFVIKELPNDPKDASYDLVFAVRKDQPELLKKINTGIDKILQSGELATIMEKWL